MGMEQISLEEVLYEKYEVKSDIQMLEFFAGYGSTSLAWKYLLEYYNSISNNKINYEHHKICEWALPSIIAYASLHRDKLKNYGVDFSVNMTKQQVAENLFKMGVSLNYDEPATLDQLKRVNEDKLRLCYNSIIWSNNLVDISRVKADDLEIDKTQNKTIFMSYSFPCITEDSLILTKRGYIQMKDVTTEDIVLTKSNTWQKVAKKFDNGVHQTCYLDAMGFENIHCTLNHKFYVREMYREWVNSSRAYIRKFKEPTFKEVKDLTRKDYFGIPIIKQENNFYTDDLDFWYMIGFYLGDGWLSKTSNDIILACNDKKLELLKSKLNQIKWKWSYSWNGTCYRFRFSNKEIYNFIKNNIGSGCEEKHIPYEILCLPKKQLNEVYEGYLNSDGSIINKTRQFNSINRELIYSMSLIINKLFNLPTKIYKIKVNSKKEIEGRIVNQKDWYQLRFKTTVDKQDKAFYENGYIWYPFNKITMAEEEHVYNMEIENDHSYIIQGCISKNCQDISNAGLSKGFSKSNNEEDKYKSETRSGLLWQVERILTELHEKGKKENDPRKYMPDILFCENVPLIESSGENLDNLIYWKNTLENLGYTNYSQKLEATNYGIPQTRKRFYMFSILDDENGNKYFYKFPKPIPLKLRLKDMLEDEKDVDEKYYLSQKLIQCFLSDGTGKYPRRERFLQNIGRENQDIANSITTLAGNRPTDNFVLKEIKNKTLVETLEKNDLSEIEDVGFIDGYNRNIKNDGNSITITTRIDASNNNFIAIKNKTKKGYLLAKEGDGIDISGRMEYHRGTVQKDKSQTITTAGGENVGVIVELNVSKDNVVGTYDYAQSDTFRSEKDRLHLGKEVSGSILSSGNQNGVLVSLKRGYDCEVKEEQKDTEEIDVIGNYSKSNFTQTSIVGKNGVAPTVTENHGQVTAIAVEDKMPKVIGGIGEKKSNGGTQYYQQDRIYDDNVAITVTTELNPYYASVNDEGEYIYLRIRKLTPKECFLLQGVKEKDYELIKDGQPDSRLYHLAGDSICCYGPLLAMYCQLLNVDFSVFFKEKEWWK